MTNSVYDSYATGPGVPQLEGPGGNPVAGAVPGAPGLLGNMTPQQRQMLALMLMQHGMGGTQPAGKVAIPQGIGGAINGAMGAYGMMNLMGK